MWLNCPGSIAFNDKFPDRSSSYAGEGTAAHSLAERALTCGKDARFFIGETITVGEAGFVVDEDMAANIQVYLDYVRREGEGKHMLFEQSLPLTPLTGEAEAFGTADTVIIDGDTIHVIDLKYGRGEEVEAKDNEQLMMYAAAARIAYSLLGDFNWFTIHIVQPRIDNIDSVQFNFVVLDAFIERVRKTSALIAAGASELNPAEATCRWCKAKAVCPALKAKVEAVVSTSFDNLEKISEVDLSDSMTFTDLVEDWSRAVRAEVERRLTSGMAVAGYKLVQGRMGARQWGDKQAAETRLKIELQYPEDIIFKKELLSPTQLEKKILKSNPEHWDRLQAFIVRKEGAPSVAPESDERPAIGFAGEGFEVLA